MTIKTCDSLVHISHDELIGAHFYGEEENSKIEDHPGDKPSGENEDGGENGENIDEITGKVRVEIGHENERKKRRESSGPESV